MALRVFFLTAWFFLGVAYSQVQLFEEGASGVLIKAGTRANQDIINLGGALEYNIESRVSFLGEYFQSLEDTVFTHSGPGDTLPGKEGIKTHNYNFFVNLELIEPDRSFPMSFGLKVGLGKANASEEAGPSITHNLNQTFWSGGLDVAGRFFIGEKGIFIPKLDYTFSYVNETRKELGNIAGDKLDDPDFWHTAALGLIYKQGLTQRLGLVADPTIALRYRQDPGELDYFIIFNLSLLFSFFSS